LTKQLKTKVLQGVKQVLKAFRLSWKLFLGIHIGVSVFSLLVLTPVFSLLMGWLILVSGHRALSDEDILFFALSPTGLLVMLLAGALYTTVVIFQQAAMIIAGHGVASGHTFDLSQLARHLLWKSWPLFKLAIQMIAHTVLIAAPFLIFGVLIFEQFLTEFDINFYLSNKPAVFWWAGGLILLDLVIMTGLLLRVFSGWVLALPLLLLENDRPSQVLNRSRQASASMRFSITMTLVALFLIHAGLFGLVSMLADLSVDGVIALSGSSLKMMSYLLGGLLVIWLLANAAVTFFGNSVLSLVILHFYSNLILGVDSGFSGESPFPARAGLSRHVSAKTLIGLALLVSLTAGLAISITMDKLNLDDHTMVVAHRGASAQAPENTLAAIELAITDGADWVEIDVQETREGEIVVIHDSDLKRVGGRGLRVFDASLMELQSVDIGSWKDTSFSDQRVPTLQQVLALCKDRIKIVIELKYYGRERNFEASVAKLVDTYGMQDQIVVMSLSYPGIQKMKSIRPDWTVGLLSSVSIGDITRLDVDFFAVNASFTTRAFVKHIHKQNRKVMVWTVNDAISMSSMMSKGVDGIITDYPALASKVRTERAQLETHERIMIQLASLIGKQPARPVQ
jgi:glycerophosphoryl diester phosphodiesterase